MSFNWQDYFTLADSLNNNPGMFGVNEAAYRCATSRAYYSAFCNARNTAITKHGLTWGKRDNAHKVVGDHFFYKSSKVENRIGRHLSRLRKRRNQADYDNSIAPPDTPAVLAQEALDLARRILADLLLVK